MSQGSRDKTSGALGAPTTSSNPQDAVNNSQVPAETREKIREQMSRQQGSSGGNAPR